MPQKLQCIMVAFEAVPFAKVGGLADVAGALPAALNAVDVETTLIVPRFGHVDPGKWKLVKGHIPSDWSVGIRWQPYPFAVWEGKLANGVSVVMLGDDRFFGRSGIYNDEQGRPFADELDRYVFFSKAVVEFLKCRNIRPDIIHLNDYHTAPIAAYVRDLYRNEPTFWYTAVIYSIHNMAHQGVYGMGALETVGFDPARYSDPYGPFEFHGQMNLMKSAIHYADIVSTVSPNYAREIMTPGGGVGLDQHLARFRDKMYGILNGIDVGVWNPAVDKKIPAAFHRGDLTGKRRAKEEIFRRARLDHRRIDMPMIGMVGRLVAQKGIDLFLGLADDLLRTNVNFVCLGSGSNEYEDALRGLASRYPDRAGVSIGFDDELAHLITAGADMFLMPSRFEPCGLNQMYSLAYGTIPIVRRTGGLADTVFDWNPWQGTGTGFLFDDSTSASLATALGNALIAYTYPDSWNRLIQNAMGQDNSWARSAWRYREIYELALANRRRYVGG